MACRGPIGGTVGLTYDPKRATPRTLSNNDLKGIVANAGWRSGEPFRRAQQVVIAESSKQTAVESANPAGGKNVGIFQIWSGNVPANQVEYLKDPVFNANVARRMYLANGGTFKNCWEVEENGAADRVQVPDLEDDAEESAVAGAVSDLGISSVDDLIKMITDRETWQRVGLVVLGGVLVTGAMLVLAGEFMKKVPTPIKAVAR